MENPKITLTGVAGSGKTALALIIAKALKEAGCEPVIFEENNSVKLFGDLIAEPLSLRRFGVVNIHTWET